MRGDGERRDRQDGSGLAARSGAARPQTFRAAPAPRRAMQDRILVDAGEDVRRNKRGKDAAEHAAERSPQIELGEPCGRRPPAIELAVAQQRKQHEGREIDADHGQPKHLVAAEQADRERRNQDRHQPRDRRMRNPRPVAKHRHEGEQIERERHDPEERRRRDIGGDVGGHRDDQAGRDRGERHPRQPVARRRRLGRGVRWPRCSAGAPRTGWRTAIRTASTAKPARPQLCLVLERQHRLDGDRIGDQRRERSEIGGGIENVGIARLRVAAGGEPALQQRRARRQDGERQSDRDREQADEPERDAGRGRRAETVRDADRQGRGGRGEDAEMDERADPERKPAHQQMGIGVTGEQRRLEEHHRHRPDRRARRRAAAAPSW